MCCGRVAYGVPGVKAVINELQVMTPPPAADRDPGDDLLLEEKLMLRLAGTKGISHTNWRVRAVNGTVYLFGRSLSEAETGRVLDIARNMKDVRKVVNHAVVRAKE